MPQKGIVFDIQKFCLHDGPGIRTTVFLKGCQMRCVWCHNPESIAVQPQLAFMASKCVGCQRCAAVCPQGCHRFAQGKHEIDFDACRACGRCVEVCPEQALKIYGRSYEVDELIREVAKDAPYFTKTGGGLTLSGGEAMFQFPFALALVKAAKQAGLHVCIETNGASRPERYREIAPWVDLFLLDYKATDAQQHKQFTGLGKRVVDMTLETLAEVGAKVILRCPLIPGYNVNDAHLAAIRRVAMRYDNILHTEILPWHNLGVAKCRELGKEAGCQQPLPETSEVDRWLETLNTGGGKPVRRA
ncbi:glycyl-radical enzyme activating protein [[Enterobacter] lignolyticus]|uniref:Pyruvate formate lyase-activating protein n=1 Tax=[Enterobacter] lignolyticus TaxID=1334193 RepID=A0A806X3A5_9ENTR|nr:glycyl-radical enzyme activating protein [[Enterobacter] lignolyticus]ALR75082.1 pyruvate formate lyase-activating protein [[Enterobacter] lignolyticus]